MQNARRVDPPLRIDPAFKSWWTGATVQTRLDGKPAAILVMELHLSTKKGNYALITEPGQGTGWFRVDLGAHEQFAKPVSA